MSIYNKVIDLQKLRSAWQHIKSKNPASGVDHITEDQFEAGEKENLKQLHLELAEHTYESLPVKKITIYRGEKARDIALYSVRDKIVQQSLAEELGKIYDGLFSNQTYAYRSHKSALSAVNAIAAWAQSGKYTYFLKVDISKFFDTIQWQKLCGILSEKIREEDLLELIRLNSCAKELNETSGELVERSCGIYQGSGIAPILSNIYLMEFDRWLDGKEEGFVRYSDDMLILGQDRDALMSLLAEIRTQLGQLGLAVNEEKSQIGDLKDGVIFLGYHLSTSGKLIPAKAEFSLKDRLELIWLASNSISLEEKLKKALEILGGWEQYYREKRNIGSILEYAALVYAADHDNDKLLELKAHRKELNNPYRDLVSYFAELWREKDWKDLELLEYEQFYQLEPTFSAEDDLIFLKKHEELLASYRRYYVNEEKDTALDIMQCYTDLQDYVKAGFWMAKKDQAVNISRVPEPEHEPGMSKFVQEAERTVTITEELVRKFRNAFAGREDIYAVEGLEPGASRHLQLQQLPLTEAVVRKHLEGEWTVGTYIQRSNSTV